MVLAVDSMVVPCHCTIYSLDEDRCEKAQDQEDYRFVGLDLAVVVAFAVVVVAIAVAVAVAVAFAAVADAATADAVVAALGSL